MALSLHRIDCSKLPLAPHSHDKTLAEVTVPDEIVQLDVATHNAWGGGLSVEQYLRRERVMRGTPFSRRGLTQWVLRDGNKSLASLETYNFDVSLSGKAGIGHGIASVYVEEAQRGHGYASELCRRVEESLKKEGGQLIILMSEVGPKLYARLGYVARPLHTRRYAAAPATESHGATPPWKLLYEADVAAALKSRKLPSQPVRVEIMAEHALWHMTRSRYYASIAGQKNSFPVGAQAGEAMTLWAPDGRADVLRILTLYPGPRLAAPGATFEPRSSEGEALRNVLHAGRTVAGELGLSAIELWENPTNANYLRGGARSADTHELPMLLGLSSGVRGEDWLDYERAHWI